jgi:hypothetical protein
MRAGRGSANIDQAKASACRDLDGGSERSVQRLARGTVSPTIQWQTIAPRRRTPHEGAMTRGLVMVVRRRSSSTSGQSQPKWRLAGAGLDATAPSPVLLTSLTSRVQAARRSQSIVRLAAAAVGTVPGLALGQRSDNSVDWRLSGNDMIWMVACRLQPALKAA